jgi:putative copper export protein
MIESLVKYVVVCALGMVLVSLAVAFRRIAMGRRDGEDSRAAVRALTLRVGLSIALVIFLVIASSLGLLRPHGLG